MHRICFTLLLTLFHGSALPQEASAEKLFASLSQSVFFVWGFDADDRRAVLGSGVVIAPGKVATNCHVIAKLRQIHVQRENVIYIASVDVSDPSRDLCQLDVKNLTAPPVAIGSARDLRVGQKVYALGNPRGLENTFSEGIVSALRGPDGKEPLVQTTAAIAAGSSGGGLFDTSGKLVGITTFQHSGTGNLNFAVPAEWLGEMGSRAKAAEEKKAAAAAAAQAARTVGGVVLAPGVPAPGTTFKYRYTDRAFGGRRATVNISVSGVDGLIVREATLLEGESQAGQVYSMVAAGEARVFERALPDGVVLSEFAPYLLANTDAEKGNWLNIPGVSTDGRPWRVSGRAVGWESVTVPAGTFRALKVTMKGSREIEFRDPRLGQHDGVNFEYTAWHAEETRRIVRMQRRMFSASNVVVADESLELVNHNAR